MKQFVILSVLAALATCKASAQTFLQHLQQSNTGQASVKVTQSKDIDELVNGSAARLAKPAEKAEKKDNKPTDSHTTTPKTAIEKEKTAPADHNTTTNEHAAEATEKHTRSTETEPAPVDTRKKVMRRSYKVKGYRVQVYAGGNSRNDKLKAQQAGNSVKQAFPDEPIYVHFYSPRWICRMGNYRSYEEASSILRQVKKMGFKQACIVSGKIDVAY